MEQYFPILLKCPLFKTISEGDLHKLLNCMNFYSKKYTVGDYIWMADDQVNTIGIILSGAVEIMKENPAGARHIVAFLGPGEIFGEGIVCTRNRISPVSVSVREDAEILFIPYQRIVHTCERACSFHQQLVQNMMMYLGEKNLNLNFKLELLMLKGMREKLATYLLFESKKQESLTFTIIPNRNELAEYLNVSRTAMCRELGRMKAENILDYYQNSFKILSQSELSKCLLQ